MSKRVVAKLPKDTANSSRTKTKKNHAYKNDFDEMFNELNGGAGLNPKLKRKFVIPKASAEAKNSTPKFAEHSPLIESINNNNNLEKERTTNSFEVQRSEHNLSEISKRSPRNVETHDTNNNYHKASVESKLKKGYCSDNEVDRDKQQQSRRQCNGRNRRIFVGQRRNRNYKNESQNNNNSSMTLKGNNESEDNEEQEQQQEQEQFQKTKCFEGQREQEEYIQHQPEQSPQQQQQQNLLQQQQQQLQQQSLFNTLAYAQNAFLNLYQNQFSLPILLPNIMGNNFNNNNNTNIFNVNQLTLPSIQNLNSNLSNSSSQPSRIVKLVQLANGQWIDVVNLLATAANGVNLNASNLLLNSAMSSMLINNNNPNILGGQILTLRGSCGGGFVMHNTPTTAALSLNDKIATLPNGLLANINQQQHLAASTTTAAAAATGLYHNLNTSLQNLSANDIVKVQLPSTLPMLSNNLGMQQSLNLNVADSNPIADVVSKPTVRSTMSNGIETSIAINNQNNNNLLNFTHPNMLTNGVISHNINQNFAENSKITQNTASGGVASSQCLLNLLSSIPQMARIVNKADGNQLN